MGQIKNLSPDDMPREKLLKQGASYLSNSELIGILIGSGSKELNAVELSRLILTENDNNLDAIARLTIGDLKKYKGIGEAKAITIASALELGRRRNNTKPIELPKITCSKDIVELLHPVMMDLNHEEFWLFCLNRSNKVLKSIRLSVGGQSSTIADPKIIFKTALDHKAAAIIIAHNHPSGHDEPSTSDHNMTKKVKAGGVVLDIPLLDHIIYTNSGYYSFADSNNI